MKKILIQVWFGLSTFRVFFFKQIILPGLVFHRYYVSSYIDRYLIAKIKSSMGTPLSLFDANF